MVLLSAGRDKRSPGPAGRQLEEEDRISRVQDGRGHQAEGLQQPQAPLEGVRGKRNTRLKAAVSAQDQRHEQALPEPHAEVSSPPESPLSPHGCGVPPQALGLAANRGSQATTATSQGFCGQLPGLSARISCV